MSSDTDRRKIDTIMQEPLTLYRLFLNGKLNAAKDDDNPNPFTFNDLQNFFTSLVSFYPQYQNEALNALEAVLTGVAPTPPKFDTPETQLIWGATLSYLSLNPEALQSWETPPAEGASLTQTPLWKQVATTRTAYRELLSHAEDVREALRDRDTKYSWSEPGTGFQFDRKSNHIKIDLAQSMIVGFEHARADVYREIGLALLSVTYPEKRNKLYQEMRPLMKKVQASQEKKGPPLKPEEYKQLRMLSAEWELRHMMFSAAEENVTNRFVANMANYAQQDYSVSINNTAVTFRLVGLTQTADVPGASDELKQYMNLCNAVQLSFFANNQLFEDTSEGWKKVGVNPDLVRKTSTQDPQPGLGIDHPDFKELRALCGGPEGLENLQPKMHERIYSSQFMRARIELTDGQRKEVIQKIWDLYAEDLIQKILKNTNDQIDQDLKEKQQQKQDGDQQQDGQENQDDGQDSDQDQQNGSPQPGKKGKQGKKGNKQRGKPQGSPSSDQDDDSNDDASNDNNENEQNADDAKQNGDKQQNQNKKGQKDKSSKGEKGDPDSQEKSEDSDQGSEQGDNADGDKSEQGKPDTSADGKLGVDKENDDTAPVEGVGDMPVPKSAMEKPSDEVDPSADGADSDADGDSPGNDADGNENGDSDGDEADDADTLEQLEKKMKEAAEQEDGNDQDGQQQEGAQQDGAEQDGDGQEANGKGKGQKSKPGKGKKKAGKGQEKSLSDLSKQDWTDYNARIAELIPYITRVRNLLKKVQESQLQQKKTRSKQMDIMPQNGEVKDRFNLQAHQNMVVKKESGQLDKEDLKRFHSDETKMVPTTLDIVIMIDGSASMGWGEPSPLNSALQACAILYEAAAGKDMNMNVYVGLWGSDNPPILIKPGEDRMKVGKTMEAMRKGLNSGTSFGPAVKKIAETMSEQHEKSGTLCGFTHVLVISDGDISDSSETKKKMETMFSYTDKVTFDVALINSNKQSSMARMADSMKSKKPQQDVGVVLSNNPEEIPLAIVGILLDKIRKCGSFLAVPSSQKRREMQKAYNKMRPK